MKILVIEDDDEVRNALIEILKYDKQSVDEAVSAEEALRKLPGDYDLIISDIMLEGMDGTELLGRLTAMSPAIPALMITGYSDAVIEEKCRMNGAAGFLKKPFAVRKLLAAVEEATGKKTGPPR